MKLLNHGSSYHNPLLKRISAAKCAYTTRRINKALARNLLTNEVSPEPGDVVLARVVKLGQHKKLELEHGRRAPLFEGDEIIVCYGNRYAPDQFEAVVPSDLSECHLVAAGGIAASCLSRHASKSSPTVIQPIGLLADANNKPLNLSQFALPGRGTDLSRPLVITVAGTSMNAGKTTTAAYLIRGLVLSGMRVGAAKITGTGAGGDRWLMNDAGAHKVLDFTDAGYASTCGVSTVELENVMQRLCGELSRDHVDAIIVEVADGLFQQETANLLKSKSFQNMTDGILFAAGDAMGASCGVQWLREHKLPVFGVSGCLSASSLSSTEAETATQLPVFNLNELSSPDIAVDIYERLEGYSKPVERVS